MWSSENDENTVNAASSASLSPIGKDSVVKQLEPRFASVMKSPRLCSSSDVNGEYPFPPIRQLTFAVTTSLLAVLAASLGKISLDPEVKAAVDKTCVKCEDGTENCRPVPPSGSTGVEQNRLKRGEFWFRVTKDGKEIKLLARELHRPGNDRTYITTLGSRHVTVHCLDGKGCRPSSPHEVYIYRLLRSRLSPEKLHMSPTLESVWDNAMAVHPVGYLGVQQLGAMSDQREAAFKKLTNDITEQLRALHEIGIIHGSVRAENIMYSDEMGRYFLVDFRLAVDVREDFEDFRHVRGPLEYLRDPVLWAIYRGAAWKPTPEDDFAALSFSLSLLRPHSIKKVPWRVSDALEEKERIPLITQLRREYFEKQRAEVRFLFLKYCPLLKSPDLLGLPDAGYRGTSLHKLLAAAASENWEVKTLRTVLRSDWERHVSRWPFCMHAVLLRTIEMDTRDSIMSLLVTDDPSVDTLNKCNATLLAQMVAAQPIEEDVNNWDIIEAGRRAMSCTDPEHAESLLEVIQREYNNIARSYPLVTYWLLDTALDEYPARRFSQLCSRWGWRIFQELELEFGSVFSFDSYPIAETVGSSPAGCDVQLGKPYGLTLTSPSVCASMTLH